MIAHCKQLVDLLCKQSPELYKHSPEYIFSLMDFVDYISRTLLPPSIHIHNFILYKNNATSIEEFHLKTIGGRLRKHRNTQYVHIGTL